MLDRLALLRDYDDQLRTDAESTSAVTVRRAGPLWFVTLAGGRGLVTYRDLAGADAEVIGQWVSDALAHFRVDPAIGQVEWKTRGHDAAPGLHEALVARGFAPDEPESIMIGEARMLDADVAVPDGVRLRSVRERADVRAAAAMQGAAFGTPASDDVAEALVRRLERRDGMQLWVAEHEGQVVCAGRLDPVAGTRFAGIWGGATLEAWRGQGLYRALLAARARSALAMGRTLIHSDSTEYSRPILERVGFVRVSSTTPYRWRRPA